MKDSFSCLENYYFRREKSFFNRTLSLFLIFNSFCFSLLFQKMFFNYVTKNLDTLDRDEHNMDSENGGSIFRTTL